VGLVNLNLTQNQKNSAQALRVFSRRTRHVVKTADDLKLQKLFRAESVQFRTRIQCSFGRYSSGKTTVLEKVTLALVGAVENRSCLLHPLNPGSTELHAANVLNFVFEQLATMKYHKTAHGPKIAEWLLTNKPTALAELKDWFGRFLGSAT
jgi:hypothetical protein